MTACTWWHFSAVEHDTPKLFYLLNLVTFLSRRQDNVQQLVLCGSLHLNFYLLKYVNVALIPAWVGTKSHTQYLSDFPSYCNNNSCWFYSLRRYSQRLSNISIWTYTHNARSSNYMLPKMSKEIKMEFLMQLVRCLGNVKCEIFQFLFIFSSLK